MNRIGIGYDLHRLVPDRPLILGGVRIPFPLGLEGPSDADVLLHAIMDALLGAAARKDLGHHFPPGDERYRDISSLVLLEEVRRIIAAEGYRVINVDAVLIAQEPRLAPYIEAMVANIAAALGISPGAVSVKATSTEGVGACGRQEAMAAQAVVLISHGEGD